MDDEREALTELQADLLALILAHDPDEVHPDDQKKCLCGETIGWSDGTVVTTEPYRHLAIKLAEFVSADSRQPAPDAAISKADLRHEAEYLNSLRYKCRHCGGDIRSPQFNSQMTGDWLDSALSLHESGCTGGTPKSEGQGT